MNATVVEEHGGPEQLRPLEVPLSQRGAGQVRIRVRLTGVNYADVQARRGSYDAGSELPFTPGPDCVGVVDAGGRG